MRHYKYANPLFIVTCLFVFFGACSRSASSEGRVEAVEGDIVTTENSPQFAQDCADIGKMYCSVFGVLVSRGDFNADLRPQDAESAQAFLRRVLAEHALRRDCRLASSEYGIAEDQVLYFCREPKGVESIFCIRCLCDNFLEIRYCPANAPEDTSIGITFRMDSSEKAEYYSVLADVLAQTDPEHAKEFRQQAVAARLPSLVGYGLLIAVPGVVVLVAIVSLWRSLRKPKPTAATEVDPPSASDGATT